VSWPQRRNGTAFRLGAFGVALVGLLAFVAWRMWTATTVCDSTFPARATEVANYVVVFATILAFVAGHLTSRVPIVRRRRAAEGASGGKKTTEPHDEEELGEGQWQATGPVVLVNLGATVFLFVVTVAVAWEAYAFWVPQWPITYYARCATFFGPEVSLGVAVVWAFVVGRLLWVFTGSSTTARGHRARSPLKRPTLPTVLKLLAVLVAGLIVVGLGKHALDVGHFPNAGSFLVSALFIGIVAAFSLFSAYFIASNPQPIGGWIQAWARRFPVLAFLLVTVLGMLVGHFYWSTQPPCPVVQGGQQSTSPDLDCRLAPTPSPTPAPPV
jgi:hypothetical protein